MESLCGLRSVESLGRISGPVGLCSFLWVDRGVMGIGIPYCGWDTDFLLETKACKLLGYFYLLLYDVRNDGNKTYFTLLILSIFIHACSIFFAIKIDIKYYIYLSHVKYNNITIIIIIVIHA